jgi:His-Xaa-Ser system protein HxsD
MSEEELIGSDKRYFILRVEAEVYSMEVCKKACYAMMSLFSSQISKDGHEFVLNVSVNQETSESTAQLQELLLDELLDYSLRESISNKTESIRNIILANAFSKTRLV